VSHLRKHIDLELFVASELAGECSDGSMMRPSSGLASKEFDHIVYQIGNEPQHAFMLPMIRDLGGTVVLHDWALGAPSWAAHPALERGGPSGLLAAWREGGFGTARRYLAHRGELHREDGVRSQLVLNRSVVRGGDAFVVHARDLKDRILIDRNAATPIAVLDLAENRSRLANEYARFLEVCPAPRSKKRSLIRTMIEASDRRRTAERRSRDGETSRSTPADGASSAGSTPDLAEMP
jgi:hypothetical protein